MKFKALPALSHEVKTQLYTTKEMGMLANVTSVSLPSQPGQTPVLLYCNPCHDVQLMSPYDSVPLYHIHGNNFEEEPAQERESFLRKHWSHPLTMLKRKKERFYADRPVWDPFRVAYEEVTDGRETFLLKSWRADLAEPRHYALLRGRLDMNVTATLPEDLLYDSLAGCFPSFRPLLPGLLKALQRIVVIIPPEELIPAYCSADDPQVSFAYLAEHHLRMLVRCCYDAGLAIEKDRLWHFFITRQQEEELTIELRQHCHPCFS